MAFREAMESASAGDQELTTTCDDEICSCGEWIGVLVQTPADSFHSALAIRH